MVSTVSIPIDRRQSQAANAVLIAVVIAFFSALLGVFFGILLDEMSSQETWVVGICALVTGGLSVVLMSKPAMATSIIAGVLSVYFVIHLNAASFIAYRSTGEFIRIVPYICWFFPLVAFHKFTNFGFHKRSIGLLVGLGPMPIGFSVLGPLAQRHIVGELAALLSFIVRISG